MIWVYIFKFRSNIFYIFTRNCPFIPVWYILWIIWTTWENSKKPWPQTLWALQWGHICGRGHGNAFCIFKICLRFTETKIIIKHTFWRALKAHMFVWLSSWQWAQPLFLNKIEPFSGLFILIISYLLSIYLGILGWLGIHLFLESTAGTSRLRFRLVQCFRRLMIAGIINAKFKRKCSYYIKK